MRLIRPIALQRNYTAGLVVLLAALFYLLLWYPRLAEPVAGYDFHIYYLAGQAALHGQSMYDPANLGTLDTSLGLGAEADHYIYPPPFMLLVAPFALLPWHLAWAGWLLLNLVAWGVAIWLLVRASGLRVREGQWAFFAAALLVPFPLYRVFFLGQVGLLTLLGLSACYYWIRTRDDLRGGVALAIAGMVKLTPFGAGLVLLFWRSWRAVLGCIAATLAGFALVVPVFGVQPLLEFPRYLLGGMDQKLAYSFNAAPAALWARLFTENKWSDPPVNAPALASGLQLLTIVLLLALTVYGVYALKTARTNSRGRDFRLDLAFCLCVTTTMLVTPLTWEHHLVQLYIPAIVIAALVQSEYRMRGWWISLFWIALVLLSLPPLFIPLFEATRSPLLLSIYTFALVVAWLAQFILVLRYSKIQDDR